MRAPFKLPPVSAALSTENDFLHFPYTQIPYPFKAGTAPPGCLAAHERFRLVLLCSQPDTVHGFPLRKTEFHHRTIPKCTAF